jgi:hypothetical protein
MFALTTGYIIGCSQCSSPEKKKAAGTQYMKVKVLRGEFQLVYNNGIRKYMSLLQISLKMLSTFLSLNILEIK